MARNLITDRARASRPQEVAEQPEGLAVPPVQRDHAQWVVDSMAVLDGLEELTPEHRDVLVTIYYRGRSVAEAAELLGIASGTVKSRTYYALRALRAAMASAGTEVVA